MKSIQEKCELLSEEYKDADKDSLMQLLLVCDGSMVNTRALLDESFERSVSKKRLAKYQSTVTSMFAKRQKLTPQGSNDPSHVKHPINLTFSAANSLGKKSTKVISIYDESQVKELLYPYISLHKNFLPQELSNKVLTNLMDNTHMFKPKEFYLFEKLCKSNHDLGLLYFPDGFNHDNAYYNGQKADIYSFNDVLIETSKTIDNYINTEIIPRYPKLPFQRPEYHVSACVVNYFSLLSNNLDWHSDRLQGMGPQNFVASFSVGSTREFRLRRHLYPNIIYSIHLPHNTLLLMHPGCQELFKHSVNSMKKPLQLNPICGLARFNLTFRYFPKDFTDNTPKCKCKIPMCLRRAYKNPDDSNFGKYHWSCENIYQNKDCKTFYWADFNNSDNNFISESDDCISTWTCQ